MSGDPLDAVDYRAMFRVLESVDRLDTAERFSRTVAEELRTHLGWRSLVFQLSPAELVDFRSGNVRLHRTRFSHTVRRDLIEELVERWGDRHPLGPSIGAGVSRRGLVTHSEMAKVADREVRHYFDTYIRPRRMGEVLHTAVDGGGRGALGLCVFAEDGPRERAVLTKLSRMLTPLLRQHPVPGQPHQGAVPMTERETQVAGLAAEGYANREIALRLGVSVGTVKKHLSQAMAKTGCTSRTQLALRMGVA
ncbi:helix-turn-helix transcriptional regulator [Allokutzneria oryzae]|uniref:LuxR C-terminal-related transcriptional regulator n=1 Tax=Allokutzneria oryzae TaxID=1378989 RepID=A0ABV6AAI4_9PSEU